MHGALVDELHAHPSRELLDVLDTATAARRQPLLFAITTAGWGPDPEGSAAYISIWLPPTVSLSVKLGMVNHLLLGLEPDWGILPESSGRHQGWEAAEV